MTHDDMKLDDRQLLELVAVARRHGAMAMIHTENADAIAFFTERLLDAGQTATRFHGPSHPSPVEREATHRAITRAELAHGLFGISSSNAAARPNRVEWRALRRSRRRRSVRMEA